MLSTSEFIELFVVNVVCIAWRTSSALAAALDLSVIVCSTREDTECSSLAISGREQQIEEVCYCVEVEELALARGELTLD